jgi:hypothetical protein
MTAPPSLHGDALREAPLPIQRSKHFSHVDDLRLEFNYEKGTGLWVPGQEVDEPALAEDRKRCLGRDQPVSAAAEASGNCVLHCRVLSAQEPLQIASAPADRDIDSGVQRAKDVLEALDRQRRDMASFESRHARAR